MKLIYILWGYLHDAEIIRAFEAEGITIEKLEIPKKLSFNSISDADATILKEYLENAIGNTAGDIVFSVNFNSVLSDICQNLQIPYCSWVLELPNFALYTPSVFNSCNYIGVCDSYIVEKMWQSGVDKAFFLPDAVEAKDKTEMKDIERGFCFIDKHPENTLNTENMTLYGKGYLDAFIHSQRVLMGANILETGLINRVYQEFISCNSIPENIHPIFQKLYVSDTYLAPVCTALQQNIILKNNENIMTIYSDSSFDMCECDKYSFVDDENDRAEVYAKKEFTLVLAPHVMHNAIPRQALETIMAGGFPICAYQKDYGYFFSKGENIACFVNSTELQQNVVKYGNDHNERQRVMDNMYRFVAENHTYKNRIQSMLEMWEKF